jgi:uncharacterized protein YbjQ (UPF0145 family)
MQAVQDRAPSKGTPALTGRGASRAHFEDLHINGGLIATAQPLQSEAHKIDRDILRAVFDERMNVKNLLTVIIISCCALSQAAVAQTDTTASVTPPKITGQVSSTGIASTIRKTYDAPGFIVTTTSTLDGFNIVEYKGLVEGAAVRVPTWNEDASAGMQQVYGGHIDSYTALCEEARVQAFSTLVSRAKQLGANAVIGIHFDSQVMPLDKGKFASGVVCVGTAVKIVKRR